MNRIITTLLILILLIVTQVNAQKKVSWKRDNTPNYQQLHLFHSTHVANIPTAETIQKGDLQFVVSHRFIPTVGSGYDTFYGFDGPANIALSLAYGITNEFKVKLSRTNLDGNLLLNGKYQLFQIDSESLPILGALEGGAAWNTLPTGRSASDNMNFQYYAQAIFNTMITKKLALGIAPTYIYNSHIYCVDKEYSFTFATYAQYYFSSLWSGFIEWTPTVSGFRNKYDSLAFGVEIETGGHFFKFVFTNNAALHPTQYHAGADIPFTWENMRIGFNITRLLSL